MTDKQIPIVLLTFRFIVPVVITTHPQPTTVSVGQSVTLSCVANSSNSTRYQWRRVKGEISSISVGVNTSTLTISSVTKQDEDKYYCVVNYGETNGSLVSVISHKAMITVYGESAICIQGKI